MLVHFPSTLIAEDSLAMIMWASAIRGALTCPRKDARIAHCPSAVVRSMHCVKSKEKCYAAQAKDVSKLTWLVLGGDPAARNHRGEQFTAL